MSKSDGSILRAMIVMFVISLLLFWLPVIGPVVAGVFGGRSAGGVLASITAAVLPSILFGTALFFLTGVLLSLPVIGAIAGMGGAVLSLAHVGPLLIGAVVGGLIA